MKVLAKQFTVFAFDTPGFGSSEALSPNKNKVRDFADALAEALEVLKMPKCAVFGNHTGASIALEFGRRHPNRVSGLVLESLPVFKASETKDILAHFFPRLLPKWDGTHLISVWSRVRDQSIWFPWFRRESSALHGWPMPNAEYMHEYAMNFFRSGDAYRAGYSAAFRFAALPAVRALKVPTTFVALKGDVLASHIERLPKLKRNQRIEHFGSGRESPANAVARLLQPYARGKAPKDPEPRHAPGMVGFGYVDLPKAQVLYRFINARKRRPLVMLHDGPGSSQRHVPLMKVLGRDRPVIAIDLPGNGGSNPLSKKRPSISDYSEIVWKICRHLGLGKFDLYGAGSGATVAIDMAATHPRRINKLALDGVMLLSNGQRKTFAARYTPKIRIDADGSHLYRTWLMLRDQLIFAPWFNPGGKRLDHDKSDFNPNDLQNWVIDVLTNRHTYHLTTQAAISYPTASQLAKIAVPTLLSGGRGGQYAANSGIAGRLLENGQTVEIPGKSAALRRVIGKFLDG
jgi:pimeloyl-ACP methyl ester carboxylesterase